ncbi:MAG: glutamate--tRNA ligase [Proteobacteria bacterium]|nr:glutamate--tRNA ligase [Pseudomonadota bacterium]MBU1742706.1 glutamate--tRNA ligase [Pseudomonadota bacterium]
MSSEIRVRFAPSPTGRLHVGNARTAVFNYLFARARGGRLVLRVEDTDRVRSRAEYETEQADDLRWLGVTWDEGPDRGGDYGPYRQSERLELYQEHVARLTEAGLTFRCYCTDEELEADRRQLLASRLPPRYVGRCRHLTEAERRAREAEGRGGAVRFRVEDQDLAFIDLIRADKKFPAGSVGDFVLLRADGTPTYTLAAVVDDALMEISHVIRGEDHLSNTARQLMLYAAWGYDPPRFAHHSLLVGPDRQKLSKRHGGTSVREFRDRGVLPEAFINYLCFLGGGLGGGEFFEPNDLVEAWDLSRTGKAAAVFDESKLEWFNREHLRALTPPELTRRLRPWWERAHLLDGTTIVEGDRSGTELFTPTDDIGIRRILSDEDLTLVSGAISPMIHTLNEGVDLAEPFFVAPKGVALPGAARPAIESLGDQLNGVPNLTPAAAKSMMVEIGRRTGLKGRALFHPVRLALTGRDRGPELDVIVSVLGPTECRRRLAAVTFEG